MSKSTSAPPPHTPLVGNLYWHVPSAQLVVMVDQERLAVGPRVRRAPPRPRTATGRVLVQVADTPVETRFFVDPSTLTVPLPHHLRGAQPPPDAPTASLAAPALALHSPLHPVREKGRGEQSAYETLGPLVQAALGDKVQLALAANVRQARQAARLTQAQLSRITGLTPQCISEIERGRGNVRIRTMALLARALDVPVYELVRAAGDEAGERVG